MESSISVPSNAVLPVKSSDSSYLLFLRDAAAAATNHVDHAVELIKSKKLGIGKWHPTGFATFEVVSIDGLGLMRLHFWPSGLRKVLPGHPPIHKHCFQQIGKSTRLNSSHRCIS